jgi:membrane fusion protein (multidrug efflux system)
MTKLTHSAGHADLLITRLTTVLAALLALALLGWGAAVAWHQLHYEETNDAQVEEYLNPINSKLSGYIRRISYEENQPVHAGDTLVVLDDRDQQVLVAEAEAALANAQAQVQVQTNSVQTAQRTATVSQAQIGAARARLQQQEQEYARYRQLLADEAVTRQQFERIETAYQVARSDYQALAGGYSTSLAKVTESRGQAPVLQAEIKRRQALLRKARLDLSYTVITAPYAGTMGRRTLQDGQLVQVGQPLATIVNKTAGKWITANFKETQLRQLHVGQAVQVTTDAYPDQTFAGRIASLSPATGARYSLLPPDNATGNFIKVIQRLPVRVELTEGAAKAALLAAGMNATVTVAK